MNERTIFMAALDIDDPVRRAAWLDDACRGDADLRKRVEALIQSHEQAVSFLNSPPPGIEATEIRAADDAAGTLIGPYKLLQKIGEGGMGVVYMAEQTEPVERRVALKIIKPGMDTRQVIARFEAERQALAMMDHPNIAKVLDAGTTGEGQGARVKGQEPLDPQPLTLGRADRPYFVMELVKGLPITQYCDEQHLTPRERLELFLPVCQAVQHAHQKGIIHRDLKPSNILVARYDDKAVPKIIDFGVAKAVSQRLTERTMFTQYGQIVGTIEYMSPEQAQFNQLDVDTRSDIYSLGVLLYELLTGETPFDKQRLRTAAFDELLRIIREEEPPRPSTRLSSSETLPSIAANRHTEPKKLTTLVRGELDWIVMKALEKDRARRYETANGLAADVLRHLADEPVTACQPSAGYRFRKFVRRNKGPVLATGVVLLCLIGGIIGTTFGLVEAKRQQRIALAEAAAKENARAAEAQQRKKAEDQRDRALKAEAQAETNFRQARQAVDDMYTQVAEKWLAQQPNLEALQREFLQKALRFYEESSQETSSDPGVRFEAARAQRRVAEIHYRLGARVQAEAACQRALELLETLADDFPTVPEYRQELADALHKMGAVIASAGRPAEWEAMLRRALALQEQLVADFPTVPEYRRDLGRGYWFLGRLHRARRQGAAEDNAYRSALAIQNRLVAEFPSVPEYRQHLADSLLGIGDRPSLQEAIAILEKLVVEYPTVPEYKYYLAAAYFWLANLLPSQEAEQLIAQALVLQEKLAADFPGHTDYRYDLSRSLQQQGGLLLRTERAADAEAAYRRAVEIGEKLAAESPEVLYYRSRLAEGYHGLAEVLRRTGRVPEAEALYERSISLYDRLLEEAPDVADARGPATRSYLGYAQLLVSAGRDQEAKRAYDRLIELNGNSAEAHNNLAWLLATSADADVRNASRAVERALKSVELAPRAGHMWNTLGVAHYRAGDWRAAITALEKSMELRKGGDSHDWFFLAMAHWQLGEKDQAREFYDRAVQWMEANQPTSDQLHRFRAEAEVLLGIE